MDSFIYLIEKLNSPVKEIRLQTMEEITRLIKKGKINHLESEEVNNHVHTIYSFSPYSPSCAAYLAWKAGLQTIGIMDHDSISGGEELILACKSLGLASTVGLEIRVNFNQTRLQGRWINSPDSKNIAYIAIHGIAQRQFNKTVEFLKPIQERRHKRNFLMVDRMNQLLFDLGMERIDYYQDVFSISKADEGGSITERHLLFALAKKFLQKVGKGQELMNFLEKKLKIIIPEKIKIFLKQSDNPYYIYDLLGVLKSSFMESIYIEPDYQECISVYEAINFAHSIDAIPAYAYLGDVVDSPTGDKKSQKFEDDYLEELFKEIKDIGFKAVTYMPPRNTIQQLERVQKFCQEYNLMEISGVDINQPRQSFNCPEILKPQFRHLIDMTWALVAHEKLANLKSCYALFNEQNPLSNRPLGDRLKLYSSIGKRIDPFHPEKVGKLLPF
ncbi:MAG: hypothetical protein Kow00103_02970 [Candidatus Caldatribacteriota bacterium]